ncbi:MAG: mevalonate kinase, partial [bacterium]
TSVNLRVYVTISKGSSAAHPLKKIIEPIIKKHLKIKTLPPYQITISSEAPIGSGLGSSAAISSSYIAALLTFLKVNWDLNLINKLAYEAEKTFQGNPSGGDNATVVYGGLIWFRKESEDLKIIHPLPFTIPTKLAKNFIFIDTGRLKEITAEMVKKVKNLYLRKPKVVEKFLGNQERLVKELLPVMKDGDEKEFIRIIRQGERNLETIGVCSKEVTSIIRNIEQSGGAAKICGAGSDSGPTGVLLCYHKNPLVIAILKHI